MLGAIVIFCVEPGVSRLTFYYLHIATVLTLLEDITINSCFLVYEYQLMFLGVSLTGQFYFHYVRLPFVFFIAFVAFNLAEARDPCILWTIYSQTHDCSATPPR